MANRRMFSKTVTNSGRFLMMPHTSQNLYWHLGMNADDEGFVEAVMVLRMTNTNEQDLKVLEANGFIEIFDNNSVAKIVDWEENNWIRPDRLQKSAIKKKIRGQIELPLGLSQKMSDTCLTQVRLGKVRLGKNTDGDKSPEVSEKLEQKEIQVGTLGTFKFPTQKKGVYSETQDLAAQFKEIYPNEDFGKLCGVIRDRGNQWAHRQLGLIKEYHETKGQLRPIQFLMKDGAKNKK